MILKLYNKKNRKTMTVYNTVSTYDDWKGRILKDLVSIAGEPCYIMEVKQDFLQKPQHPGEAIIGEEVIEVTYITQRDMQYRPEWDLL